MARVPGIFLVRTKKLVQHCLPIQNAWYSGTVPGRPGLDWCQSPRKRTPDARSRQRRTGAEELGCLMRDTVCTKLKGRRCLRLLLASCGFVCFGFVCGLLKPKFHGARRASLDDNLLERTYILNVPGEDKRFSTTSENVQDLRKLGPVVRFEAATPEKDFCTQPYSIHDCCSVTHLRAIEDFVHSEEDEHAWALILEDDIGVHPEVPPGALAQIVQDAISLANKQDVEFVYFGVCLEPGETCRGGNDHTFVGGNVFINSCKRTTTRRCTHAYGVRRNLAVLLPDLVRQVGTTIDEAYESVFKSRSIPNLVVGVNLLSPEWCSHVGLLYQRAEFWASSLTHSSLELQPCSKPTLEIDDE